MFWPRRLLAWDSRGDLGAFSAHGSTSTCESSASRRADRLTPPPADERGWLALAYTIFIGGIVGFGLWFWLIARCSVGRVAPFGLLLPVFAVISSVLFMGDRMTPKLIVGGVLAISDVAIRRSDGPRQRHGKSVGDEFLTNKITCGVNTIGMARPI